MEIHLEFQGPGHALGQDWCRHCESPQVTGASLHALGEDWCRHFASPQVTGASLHALGEDWCRHLGLTEQEHAIP